MLDDDISHRDTYMAGWLTEIASTGVRVAIDPHVERFLDSVRNAYLAGLAPDITAADILNILDDWQLRANVVGALQDRNDQELRRFVLEFMEELAAGLDHLADSDDRHGSLQHQPVRFEAAAQQKQSQRREDQAFRGEHQERSMNLGNNADVALTAIGLLGTLWNVALAWIALSRSKTDLRRASKHFGKTFSTILVDLGAGEGRQNERRLESGRTSR
jgi:hypothetical protein